MIKLPEKSDMVMFPKKYVYFSLIILLFVQILAGCGERTFTAEEQEVVDTALAWLKLIDEQKYEESWEASAFLIKNNLTARQWVIGLEQIRKPFGKGLSRKMIESHPWSSRGITLYTIAYKTKFENNTTKIERVSPVLMDDKSWKVGIYQIKDL
ncbi:MAG: DUF4019 domain-containing protein [Calditrichia bacterium]